MVVRNKLDQVQQKLCVIAETVRQILSDQPRLVQMAIPVSGLMVGFLVTDYAVARASEIPLELYHSPSIALAMTSRWQFFLILAFGAVLLGFGWRENRWERLPHRPILRWIALSAIVGLLWTFTTHGYNFFLDQWHLGDRLLLLVLGALVWFHPSWMFPFLILLTAFIGQTAEPFYAVMSDKLLPFNLIGLFIAYLFYRSLRLHSIEVGEDGNRQSTILLATFLMVTVHYTNPGFSKILIGWPWREDVSDMLFAAHVTGWMGTWSNELMEWVTKVARLTNPVSIIGTLIIEAGFIFALLKRNFMIFFLAAAIGLHSMIFALSGILFWLWIIVDVVLIISIVKMQPNTAKILFGRHSFALAIVATLVAPIAFQAPALAWYETPYTNYYQLEVVGESGERYIVPWESMAPYDIAFGQSRFHFADENNTLVWLRGVTHDWSVASPLKSVNGPEDIQRIEEEFGTNHFNSSQRDQFVEFLHTWALYQNHNIGNHSPLEWIEAPLHIWYWGPPGGYEEQEPIEMIELRRLNHARIGDGFQEVGNYVVLKIRIDG